MRIDLDALRSCATCGCIYDEDYCRMTQDGNYICPACQTEIKN